MARPRLPLALCLAAAALGCGRSAQQPSPLVGVDLLPVPAGSVSFMGHIQPEPGPDEHEQLFQVTVTQPFLLGRTELTQQQWRELMHSEPSHFRACGASCPVEQVSWIDALRFCNALSEREGLQPAYRIQGAASSWDLQANGYRLPTEAEWLLAARAGTEQAYAGSDDADLVSWHSGNAAGRSHPVAEKQPNSLGLFDMSGNVWEWVWDGWSGSNDQASVYRPVLQVSDPAGPASATERVYRGGSWSDDASIVHLADRDRGAPDYRMYYVGFRVARSGGG